MYPYLNSHYNSHQPRVLKKIKGATTCLMPIVVENVNRNVYTISYKYDIIINTMRIRLELLNLLTGFTLLLVGILDLSDQQYIRAASWIIFGSMYLVMNGYSANPVATTRLERITQYTRPIFGWVGFVGSILLLIYRLTIY